MPSRSFDIKARKLALRGKDADRMIASPDIADESDGGFPIQASLELPLLGSGLSQPMRPPHNVSVPYLNLKFERRGIDITLY